MDDRLLPLFPLPVVLFPGVARPLHIFEPRYRRLIADCLDGDRRFGLLFCADTANERALPPGQVGCIARIESADALPDGRSNIIIAGEERFALVRFIESDAPY
ncbi:MAG: LON peptidase substrate-binding domain-containing protein, partial [Gemmatimonadaceae bacterium]